MASRPQRITNAHRAAVCALVIARVPFRDACFIAGAPMLEVRAHLPEKWFGRQTARKMTDHDWRQLRAAYEAQAEPVDDLCARFGIGTKTLYRRIEKGGWIRRGAGRRPKPGSVRSMTQKQRWLYRKLRYRDRTSEAVAKVAVWAMP